VWWQVEGPDSETGRVKRRFSHRDSFMEEAQRRGLPVVWPMGDRQDRLEENKIWRLDEATMIQIAERYGVSLVLTGRAIASPAGWNGQWKLYFDGDFFEFPVRNDREAPGIWHESQQLETLEALGVQLVVEQLLRRYAFAPGGGEQEVSLVVRDVRHFRAYTEVMKYLQTLEAVAEVRLQRVERDTQFYQLRYRGQLSALEELLSLGGVLNRDEAPVPVLTVKTPLSAEGAVAPLQPPLQIEDPGLDVPVVTPQGQAEQTTLYYRYSSRI
jgi:hypothetical protein